jgi:RND family efflux transporter MFP subunit
VAALALGCEEKKPEQAEEAKPAPVKAVPAEEETFGQWTEMLGTTLPLPNHSARVTAAVEGRVQSVLHDAEGHPIEEGQHVEAGQELARLDDQVIRANKARLEAQLREFVQQKVQAGIAVETAQIDVDRYEKLSREQATAASVSPVELKKANLALQSARSAQEGVLAKEQSARADLKALEAQLGFYTLRAPIAGRLGVFQVQRGQTLTTGTMVSEVIDLDQVDTMCFVPPEVVSRLQVGQLALVVGEGSSSRAPVLLGEVVFIAHQAQADTGNFAVKARFRNQDFRGRLAFQALRLVTGLPLPEPEEDPALRANAVARVYVLTEPAEERWSVPDEAVLEDRSPPGVVVVQDVEEKPAKDKDKKPERFGKARVLDVELGVRDRAGHHIEIHRLLDPKTKKEVSLFTDKEKKKPLLFVTEGGHGLRDGDPVKVEQEEEEEKKD